MKKLITHGILIGVMTMGAALPLTAQTSQDQDTTGGAGQGMNHHRMHGQWRAQHDQMAADVKARDAELQQLVDQMNNAPPQQKADAVAAVVNKLVEDRLALHKKMEEMHQQMQGTNAVPDQSTAPAPSGY